MRPVPELAANEEVTAKEIPRRGRLWVIAVLALFLLALGYSIADLSTKEASDDVVEISGIGDAQRIFGGVPQIGDRVGSSDAPVAIQVFNDLQCSNCREDFLSTIPALVEDYARPGDVKLLYRHYSNSINTEQLGFYGAEAAAEQGYGWQYTYLFFRNQAEAERFGIDEDYLATIAGSVGEIDVLEWKRTREAGEEPDSAIQRRLEGYEELGRGLGIRIRQAAIVTGPNGTRTLQDGPSLAEIERAIEAVE
jgi:protein-disulfide isomerase